METTTRLCPICQQEEQANFRDEATDCVQVRCPRCGHFALSGTLFVALTGELSKHVDLVEGLVAYIKLQNERGNVPELKIDTWQQNASRHTKGIDWDALPPE